MTIYEEDICPRCGRIFIFVAKDFVAKDGYWKCQACGYEVPRRKGPRQGTPDDDMGEETQ